MKKIPGFIGAYTCEVCTNTYVAEEGERKEFKRLFGDA